MERVQTTGRSAWVFLRAIGGGVMISLIGVSIFPLLTPLNARFAPELPWAGVATLSLVALGISWLHGVGWPGSSRAFRRHALRLWRPPADKSSQRLVEATVLVLLICAVYAFYIYVATVIAPPRPAPDLSAYPTTATRFAALITGALVAGVVEEAAFRGYMQSQLERFGPALAIVVTSVVFTLAHASHGLDLLVRMAPGYFTISVLWGLLAWRTGSILPGMALHAGGDMLVAYYVLLDGDGGLLFAP
jgi:membrane protease YdiL (CAAX protease family)